MHACYASALCSSLCIYNTEWELRIYSIYDASCAVTLYSSLEISTYTHPLVSLLQSAVIGNLVMVWNFRPLVILNSDCVCVCVCVGGGGGGDFYRT